MYVLGNPIRYSDPTGHYIPIEGDPGDPDFIGVGGTDDNPAVFFGNNNYVEEQAATLFLAIENGVDPVVAERRMNARLNRWFGGEYPVGFVGFFRHTLWNQNPWVPKWMRDRWNRTTGGLQTLGPTVASQGMRGQQGLGLRQVGQTNYFTSHEMAAVKIARGHAYQKHVVERGEFPGVSTPQEFEALTLNVINSSEAQKSLARGRYAYWKGGIVVIIDPNNPDMGTVFRPSMGRRYFDEKLY